MDYLKQVKAGAGLVKKQLRSFIEEHSKRRVQKHVEALQKLEFFHSKHFGSGKHLCNEWLTKDNCFVSDAAVAIVVTRAGIVSGLIAFEINGSHILIRQLQGAPNGNFGDNTPVGKYLTECSRELAKALKMKLIWVVTPETVIDYRKTFLDSKPLSEGMEARIRRIYEWPGKLGWKIRYCFRFRREAFVLPLS